MRKIATNYKLPYYTLSPTYSICREHGYLVGEQKICPHCGKVTEVYSRITGYYRPVQNWNDGKLQEYKKRTEYDIENSVLKRSHGEEVVGTQAEKVQPVEAEEVKYLFTTKTCPHCGLAKELLKDMEYVLIDAEENMELTRKYGVMQAPTLVVSKDGNVKKYVNVSNITKYTQESKMA